MAILEAVFADKQGQTPQDIERRRRIAKELLAQSGGAEPIRSPWQGAAKIAQALVGGYEEAKADRDDTANRASASKSLIDAVFGGGSGQSAPSFASQAAATSTPGSGSASAGNVDPSIREGIVQTAGSLGIDPVDLATAISYETAGTFDPRKKGPTTQWGQHEGLIQFGEPQAKKYGVDWSNPVGSQLGENGAVANYLRDTGVKPGMGLLDIYSAINAGGVGRYGASDANNGGAPGTVADKVNQQMSGHRQKALALIGEPAQVASLDPSAGMTSTDAVNVMASNAPQQQMAQPAQQGIPAEFAGSQQLANARGGIIPALMGGTAASPEQIAQARALGASQPQPQPQGQDNRALIAELLGNPYTAEAGQQLLMQEMQRRQEASDPVRQMEMEKQRLELEAMRNPQADPLKVGEGETVIDPRTGKVMYQGQPKTPAKPSAVQEYEYAKEQGFPGTFQDWEASKKGGMSLQVDPATGAVTFQQGGNIKPMTEGQSKDTVFATRAQGSLPLIDEFGAALTGAEGLIGGTVGQLPVVGNYAKSEAFQKAEQAGKEFLQAILRKDTGAAITKEETAEYGSVYLPRPGDSPEFIEQKRASRLRALEAIKAGMPPQAILAQEKALRNTEKASQQSPAGDAGPAPEGVDADDWKYMTPEERKLFQ